MPTPYLLIETGRWPRSHSTRSAGVAGPGDLVSTISPCGRVSEAPSARRHTSPASIVRRQVRSAATKVTRS